MRRSTTGSAGRTPGGSTAGATTTTYATAGWCRCGHVGRRDLLPDCGGIHPSHRRKVRADHAATAVYFVTGCATGLGPIEDRLAGRNRRCIRRRRYGGSAPSCGGRCTGLLQAPQIGDDLPDLRVRQRLVRVHLRAGKAVTDRFEDVGIGIAVGQTRRVQGRRIPLPVADGALAVAVGAGALEDLAARSNGRRIVRLRVNNGVGRRGRLLLGHEDPHSQTDETEDGVG